MQQSYYLYVFLIFCYLVIGYGNAKNIAKSSEESREIVNINGTRYYISANGVTFTALEAMRVCNDLGMKLISIVTEEKQNMISEYLHLNGHDDRLLWTSGMCIQAGVYAWLGTGEEFTYTNWYNGQPDDPSQDICVYFDTINDKWSDKPCGSLYGYMCEEIKRC